MSNTNYHLNKAQLDAIEAIFDFFKKDKFKTELNRQDIDDILRIHNADKGNSHSMYQDLLSIIFDELEAQGIIIVTKPNHTVFIITDSIKLTNLGRKIVNANSSYSSFLNSQERKELIKKRREKLILIGIIVTAIATLGYFIIELINFFRK